jgi:kynurenine formamidase
MSAHGKWFRLCAVLAAVMAGIPAAQAQSPIERAAATLAGSRVVDLTVTTSGTLPANWADGPRLQRWAYNWFVPKKDARGNVIVPSDGPYYAQRYVIDEHTGTHTDFPAHFIPPPGSGLPHAGPEGNMTGDHYPPERLMGPADVIDVTALLDKAPGGVSPRITVAQIQAWEKAHGPIRKGDVVLLRSGYTDKYYKPFPEGLRMTFDPMVTKSAPGWPAPDPETIEYIYSKGVIHMGTDGASMGPADAGQGTHVAGFEHGMAWEETLAHLDQLPARGAFYIALPIKVVDQSGGPARALAFVPR